MTLLLSIGSLKGLRTVKTFVHCVLEMKTFVQELKDN